MTIHEKLKALLTADANVSALVNTRVFMTEAPQNCTIPYVVFMAHEDVLVTHNSSLEGTRPWKVYIYPFGATPLSANLIGVAVKRALCGYKFTDVGIADTDIQAITLEQGLMDLERLPESKSYPVSLVVEVWEQLA